MRVVREPYEIHEKIIKTIRKPCQRVNTKALSNFWIRKPCQTLITKAQLFEIFLTAFVTDRYELIPSLKSILSLDKNPFVLNTIGRRGKRDVLRVSTKLVGSAR